LQGSLSSRNRTLQLADLLFEFLNPIKRKQRKTAFQELEQQISQLEGAIATAETSLQNFVSAEETARVTRELDQSRADLAGTRGRMGADWPGSGRRLLNPQAGISYLVNFSGCTIHSSASSANLLIFLARDAQGGRLWQ